MSYYICHILGSGIISNQSYMYDNEGDHIYINPFNSDSQIWGKCDYEILESPANSIEGIDIIWETEINGKNVSYQYLYKDINNSTKDNIIFGLEPLGRIAVWTSNEKKQKLIFWSDSSGIQNSRELFMKNEYTRIMKQFKYRYTVNFEKWDGDNQYDEIVVLPVFSFIEEELYDGTYDKLHDNGLLKYHEAGTPKKLLVKWVAKRSDYSAYFWFDAEEICSIFDKFYGAHRDTKTDFIIHIDPEKNKYELALYRNGLKEPQVIAERAYQLIVFKNKFEFYRSENYDQPNGAWIW